MITGRGVGAGELYRSLVDIVAARADGSLRVGRVQRLAEDVCAARAAVVGRTSKHAGAGHRKRCGEVVAGRGVGGLEADDRVPGWRLGKQVGAAGTVVVGSAGYAPNDELATAVPVLSPLLLSALARSPTCCQMVPEVLLKTNALPTAP